MIKKMYIKTSRVLFGQVLLAQQQHQAATQHWWPNASGDPATSGATADLIVLGLSHNKDNHIQQKIYLVLLIWELTSTYISCPSSGTLPWYKSSCQTHHTEINSQQRFTTTECITKWSSFITWELDWLTTFSSAATLWSIFCSPGPYNITLWKLICMQMISCSLPAYVTTNSCFFPCLISPKIL